MSKLIWGILLVLIGTDIIFNALFGFSFPFIKIAFGLFFIYFGMTLLTGFYKPTTDVYFKKTIIEETEIKRNYHVRFGEAFINLANTEIIKPTNITVSTFFGATTLVLNKNIPTRVTVHTSFGSADLPDSTQLAFGVHTFEFGNQEEQPYLEVSAYVTFGSLVIKKR